MLLTLSILTGVMLLGSVATFVLLYPPGAQAAEGPVMKKPNASLKEELTNSGYSSEPKTNLMVSWLHCGTISNSSTHKSWVAIGSIATSCGSLPEVPLQVPILVLLFGPIAFTADPVVNKIPLVIPTFVVFPLENVPYAAVGQFKATFVTVSPWPARLDINVAAETPGVTVSCA
jgi:hypothetical protein